MRVPPPGLLKLDRRDLLRDVKERLGETLPHYRKLDDDPTDPGWLLLEQAAWLVELLSEQLDDYPFSVVQQFVHMMGGHLHPAQPACGVLVAEVGVEGDLRFDDKRPSPWRFFTAQTEDLDAIEFAPVESGVPLRQGAFASMCELAADELYVVSDTEEGSGQSSVRGSRRRSAVFTRETVHYDAVSNAPDTLVEAIENAMKHLAERRVGWLNLEIERIGSEKVRLTATVRPDGAFVRVAPAGIAAGGDLEGDWGTLDGSTWTPVVHIRPHPLLPPHLHDQFPLPGYEEGQILLTDIPENFPVVELLERKASPMPESVVEAVWQTLSNLDSRLSTIRPKITIEFPDLGELAEGEPTWVAEALSGGVWPTLSQNQPRTLVHLALEDTPRAKKASMVRVGVVHEAIAGARLPRLTAYGIVDGRLDKVELKCRERWRLPGPPRENATVMPTIVAYDIELPPNGRDVLFTVAGRPSGVMLNAMMVANVPAVPDGRQVVIDRNVPIAFSLLDEDTIDRSVIDHLLQEPIHTNAAAVLRRLPLAWFECTDGVPVRDFEGVKIDPSEGTLTFNAPDTEGDFRAFRAGNRIRLEWYRRTDGAAGNRPADTVRLVEQPPTAVPSILSVTNPLGMYFGADRESPEAAIDRMFGPAGGTPVLASDFERFVRQALGTRGRGWFVRCWTYAERALVTSTMWPFADQQGASTPEAADLAAQLDTAGPDTLLVVVGLEDGVLPEDDLDWARRAVTRLVDRVRKRLPVVKNAIVTRFTPLELELDDPEAEAPVLPNFELDAMQGTLRDPQGREVTSVPNAVLLLNAGVVRVTSPGQEVL